MDARLEPRRRRPRLRIMEKLPRNVPHLRSVRAVQPELLRQIELRILRAGTPTDLTERFYQELRDLARLNHPVFPAVLMRGKVKGRTCYAVPFSRAPGLDELLEEKDFGLAERLACLRDLAGALAAAHQNDVLVGDLGLGDVTLDRRTGAVRVPYLSPGGADGGTAADVHHWGRLAEKLLADCNAEIPERVAYVVEACLEPDPSYRPEDGVELFRAMRGAPTLLATGSRRVRSAPPMVQLPGWAGLARADRSVMAEPAPERWRPSRLISLSVAAALLGVAAAWAIPPSTPIPVPPPARMSTPAEPAARVPEARPEHSVQALAPSAQARYTSDPRIRRLLETGPVTRKDFPARWRHLRKLVLGRRLPAPLDGWRRVFRMKQTFQADPDAGCAAFDRYLRDLRVMLGEAPPAT